MAYNKYNNKNSKNQKYKKPLLSNNAKFMLTLSALSITAFSISGIDYLQEQKELNRTEYQQMANEVVYTDTKTIEQIQDEVIKDNAKHYYASGIMNEYSKAFTYEDYESLNDKYVDKYLEITGEVNKTHETTIDGHFLTLINDNPINNVSSWGKIYCYVEDTEDKKIFENIKSGDKITVIGYCDNDNLTFDVQDCDIVKINGKKINR
jgi:hypothetical protein